MGSSILRDSILDSLIFILKSIPHLVEADAGGVVPESVLRYARTKGLYVLVQTGEAVAAPSLLQNPTLLHRTILILLCQLDLVKEKAYSCRFKSWLEKFVASCVKIKRMVVCYCESEVNVEFVMQG